MTTIEKVRNIFQLIGNSDITELFWEKDNLRLDLRREISASTAIESTERASVETEDLKITSKTPGDIINSPMVGTFYMTHPKSKQVYATKGLRVNIGQVVGVIEAMKVYSEIFSPILLPVLSRWNTMWSR